MNTAAFVRDLLQALAALEAFERVDLNVEGPVVDGRAYVRDEAFLRSYFNQRTQTLAFALIEGDQRTWGVDRDSRRGWHLHPSDSPQSHVAIGVLSVVEIIARLGEVLEEKADRDAEATPPTG